MGSGAFSVILIYFREREDDSPEVNDYNDVCGTFVSTILPLWPSVIVRDFPGDFSLFYSVIFHEIRI